MARSEKRRGPRTASPVRKGKAVGGVQSKTAQPAGGKGNSADPTPPKINLSTVHDIRVEMARVYREMRAGAVDCSKGCKQTYVLSQMARLIEVHELEQRVKELEGRLGPAATD